MKKIAETLGVDYDLAFNENLKGVSRSKSLELILKKGNMTIEESKFEEYLELKNSFYMKSIEGLSANDILPGVVSTIQKAKKLGLFCIIGSSSKNGRLILDKVGLLDAFDFIVDGNDLKAQSQILRYSLKEQSWQSLILTNVLYLRTRQVVLKLQKRRIYGYCGWKSPYQGLG